MGLDDLYLLPELCAGIGGSEHPRIRGTECETAVLLSDGGPVERRVSIRLGKADGQTSHCPAGEPKQDLGRVCRWHTERDCSGHGTLLDHTLYALAGHGHVRCDHADGIRWRSNDVRNQARPWRKRLWDSDHWSWRSAGSDRFDLLFGARVFS